MERGKLIIEGLEKLRTAAIIYIISSILIGVGILSLFISIYIVVPSRIVMPAILFGIGIVTLAIIGAFLGLIALFVYLIPAFSKFRNTDPAFSTPYTLVKLGFSGGLIIVFLAMIIIAIGVGIRSAIYALGGFITMVIGVILLIIGIVGLIIGTFKLRDITGEELFTVAGILFIVGIFISILQFVAWILVLIAAGSAIRKVRGPQIPPPPI